LDDNFPEGPAGFWMIFLPGSIPGLFCDAFFDKNNFFKIMPGRGDKIDG